MQHAVTVITDKMWYGKVTQWLKCLSIQSRAKIKLLALRNVEYSTGVLMTCQVGIVGGCNKGGAVCYYARVI